MVAGYGKDSKLEINLQELVGMLVFPTSNFDQGFCMLFLLLLCESFIGRFS